MIILSLKACLHSDDFFYYYYHLNYMLIHYSNDYYSDMLSTVQLHLWFNLQYFISDQLFIIYLVLIYLYSCYHYGSLVIEVHWTVNEFDIWQILLESSILIIYHALFLFPFVKLRPKVQVISLMLQHLGDQRYPFTKKWW